MNYLRNVFRFISAYIVIAFTLQRLFIVYLPLSNYFKSKKSAWITVGLIVLVAIVANSWILFIFELQLSINNSYYCNVKQGWDKIYFNFTLVYICTIMLIPILIIFASNSLLIVNLRTFQMNRRQLSDRPSRNQNNIRLDRIKLSTNETIEIKPYFLTMNQIISRVTNQANTNKKITKMLILISFSYALLNLPYFITWSLFYYNETFVNTNRISASEHNYYYSALKICELFFVLNYAIYFYIYILSGSVFRNQLKYSSNLDLEI